jgi:phage tail tape-measure protein
MQTKLTLRLEQRLIRRAKAYARRTGKSVSELVADFFGRLEAPTEAGPTDAVARSPAVQSLVGALAGARVGEADYRAHLIEKHR